MKSYSLVIFDLDDTLWDTKQNSKEALLDIFSNYRLDRFYENYEEFHILFLTQNELLWEKYNHGEITKEELQGVRFRNLLLTYTNDLDFYQMNEDFIETTCSKSKIIDGAHEILDYLSPKYRMCILSNSFERALNAKVENSNFPKYFNKIYSSELIQINKPDPRAFEYVLKDMNCKKEDAIMIGDNFSTDILGAKRSGVDQVWFTQEENSKNVEFCPTHSIHALNDLKFIL